MIILWHLMIISPMVAIKKKDDHFMACLHALAHSCAYAVMRVHICMHTDTTCACGYRVMETICEKLSVVTDSFPSGRGIAAWNIIIPTSIKIIPSCDHPARRRFLCRCQESSTLGLELPYAETALGFGFFNGFPCN